MEKASPKLAVKPSSGNVRSEEVIELTVNSDVALPESAKPSLTCTQGTFLYPAEKVCNENIKQIDSNRFQVVAPPQVGTYRFRAQLEGTDNYSAASAECEIEVLPDFIVDLPFDPPANETTVDVGNGQEIRVTVSGGQAAVKEISQEQLKNALKSEAAEKAKGLVLDFSNTGSTVTSVKMPASALENVTEAVNNPDNSAESVDVKLSNGSSVKIDGAALSAIVSQLRSTDVTISLKKQLAATLSPPQQSALKRFPAVGACFDVTVSSGGEEIHSLGGGTADVTVSVDEVPQGSWTMVGVCIDSQGGVEYLNRDSVTSPGGGVYVQMSLFHMSLYAIVYVQPTEATKAAVVALEALPQAGELKTANAKAAVKAAKAALKQVASFDEEQRAVVGKALVDNAEQVVERGGELVAKADAKAAKKVKGKSFSVKAGTSKSIVFNTTASAAGTKVVYKKVKGSKLITVTKSGKVTAKKGMKKGKTYTAKLKIICGKAVEYVKVKVKAR
ncbi:MAG: hypothetical protein ACI36V_07435 [Coriobacteriales bacterium]